MIPDLYARMEIPEEDRITALGTAKAAFLYTFLQDQKVKLSLETGFAYGGSAAFILSATEGLHYAMDPFQESIFHNLGLRNIASLGLEARLRFQSEPAHLVLPRLLTEGVQLDFALIDGDHKFDSAFVDFYFLDLLMKEGGFIAIDDCRMPSVASVVDWIQTNKTWYRHHATGVTGLTLWEKRGQDERPWQHFVPFQTHPLWHRLRRRWPFAPTP